MPKNTIYAFVNTEKKSRYSSLKIQESNTQKNHGRKAIFVTLALNIRQSLHFFTQKFPGFIASNIHLSIDAHYLADSAHKPAEHATIVLENAITHEKIVLHCNYKLHTEDTCTITGKRISCIEGVEHDQELLTFNTSETLQIKIIIQAYTQLRRRFIDDHSAAVNALEQEITHCYTNIATTIYEMEHAQRNNNSTVSFKQHAIKKTETLLLHLETYNIYSNQVKHAQYKHALNMLEQLKETNIVSPSEPAHLPAVETSALELTSSIPRTPISTQAKKYFSLAALKKEIEETLNAIKIIQAEPINSVDQLTRIKSLQEILKINLTILFCDHTTKYTVDLRNFIAETEAYLRTIKTIELHFMDCLKIGDLEGVKLIYPHIREKIESDNEGNIFTLLLGGIENNDFAFTEKLIDIGDYFFHQNSQGFRDVIEVQSLIYYRDNATGYSHSVLHKLFLDNRISAFTFLLKYSLAYQLNQPALFIQQYQFNIVQSVIARFMVNKNIAFFRIFHQLEQLNTLASENKPTPLNLEAISYLSTSPLPLEHTATYNAMIDMDYFELIIHFTIFDDSYDPIELIQFLREKFDLKRIAPGLAKLLNIKSIQSRLLPTSTTSQVLFFDNKEACDIETRKTASSSGKQLSLFFYATQETSSIFKETIKSVLAIVIEKFRLLPLSHQRALTLHSKETAEKNFADKKINSANDYILLAQVLNSLSTCPSEQDYYVKLQLLCWRAKLLNDEKLAQSIFAITHVVLNNIPENYLKTLSEDTKFNALSNSIMTKASSIHNNPNILLAAPKNSPSKEEYERRLREIAQSGDADEMQAFFNELDAKNAAININAQGEKTKKTALHQLVYGANVNKSPTNTAQYSACLQLLLQHGANDSWEKKDINQKTPEQYNTRNALVIVKQNALSL